MAQTPQTSVLPYCTAAQVVYYCDVRTLGQVLFDDGLMHTEAQVLISPALAEFMGSAAGTIESVASRAEKYFPADLAAIQAGSGNGAKLLAKINVGLALRNVFQRRPELMTDTARAVAEEAEEWLEALGNGERCFGTAESEAAGIPSHYRENWSDVQARNGAAWQARRMFGNRTSWDRWN